ncbi:MAG TPA: glucan biosynthesis protein G [Candidatus Limnocylindria bacterium]|jgi:glucans biosynthesis protein|nr:glucan biosynthesis protein G [Candidatus Limnocylindria bacterium]
MKQLLLVGFLLALAGPPSARGFDFTDVQALAKERAARAYQPPDHPLPRSLADLKYEAYQKITFKASNALWFNDSLPFRIEFFHRGHFHVNRPALNEIVDGRSAEIPFRAEFFDYQTNRIEIPSDLGFAGFRVISLAKEPREIAVFLDASYCRMTGTDQVYGTSARGLALDTGLDTPEEFPLFEQFWLCRPGPNDQALTIYALMDSPSVAGAYRYVITPGADTLALVTATVIQRKSVRKFGIAPLSSMFLHGKNGRPPWQDFRPEVHDSDGLLIRTGKAEWIWHSLEAGKMIRFNSFQDENPQGFGLIQRERNFEQFQDLQAYFQARPNVWVQPRGKWGKGALELVQLPSQIEFTDNVAAFWVPDTLPPLGEAFDFEYELHWTKTDPSDPQQGQVIATRVSRVPDTRNLRFVIDFGGPWFRGLSSREQLALDLKYSSNVKFVADSIFKNEINGTWRAVIEIVEPEAAADLRAFLKRKERPATETWTFTWQP